MSVTSGDRAFGDVISNVYAHDLVPLIFDAYAGDLAARGRPWLPL